MILLAALGLACESQRDDATAPAGGAERAEGASEAAAPAPVAKPADPATVDFDRHARTLSQTLLNPYGSRDLALSDIATAVWGIERPRGEHAAKHLELVCQATVEQGCAQDLSPELRYFAVLRVTLEQLAKAARAQDQEAQAAALESWAARTGEMVAQGNPATVPLADEPLSDLHGDPVLMLRRSDEDDTVALDVLVGPTVVRTIHDALAEESAARGALFDMLAAGDLFTATGLVAPADAKIEKQPGTPLRLLLAAEAPLGPALELLRKAYAERRIQQVELVVRSREYGTLSGLELNLVNTSIRGSDHGVQVSPEQITWRAARGGDDEDLEGVGWGGLDRLREIVRAPHGQLVVYVEADPSLSGQQLIDALSALRARCGEQALCQSLQLALALKSTDTAPK